MDIVAATREYEAWLAAALPAPIYQPDVHFKHQRMADPADPFPFFRGTYYRWAQLWTKAAGQLTSAPKVLSIGDLHIENFGTWRDADGRLCWGVNDFDEADELPYTHDLVRLVASVRVGRKAGVLDVKFGETSETILGGYQKTLAAGGRPFVLEERHAHLRAMAIAADREPVQFWSKMTALLADPPAAPPSEAKSALAAVLPAVNLTIEYRFRPQAGVGSLGRPRYVALAEWAGGWICREAKAAAPPATVWAVGRTPSGSSRSAVAVRQAVRSPDPYYRPADRWVVRRLGPKASRIELTGLVAAEAERVLEAMGAEVANVHLGTPGAATAILADLAGRPNGWLEDAARLLADSVEKDWTTWLKSVDSRS
jgi:Uncharacterized protein conserved in bacteria (DUF2252)